MLVDFLYLLVELICLERVQCDAVKMSKLDNLPSPFKKQEDEGKVGAAKRVAVRRKIGRAGD